MLLASNSLIVSKATLRRTRHVTLTARKQRVLGPTANLSLRRHWAYSTGQVPSHTFLLIGRFLQFCIRLVPENEAM